MRGTNNFAFIEAELSAATAAHDDHHHALLRGMKAAAANYVEELAELRRAEEGDTYFLQAEVSRRKLLLSGLVGFGAVGLAGCGNSDDGTDATSTTAAAAGASGDLAVANLAAALENLAVATYEAAGDTIGSGKLGEVPPAIVAFVQTARRQHRDHASAWNAVLSQSNVPVQNGIDITVNDAVVKPELANVTDVPGLARLALELENSAAATYQNAVSMLRGQQAILTAASIQPVEMQHVAILNFILGQDPVPVAFSSVQEARTIDDKVGPVA